MSLAYSYTNLLKTLPQWDYNWMRKKQKFSQRRPNHRHNCKRPMSVLDRESSHKWLGCMLTTSTVQTTTCDVECRLQAAAKTFNANKWILCDPKVSIALKIEYFDRVITPIACLAAGHRTVYRNDVHKMDVAYRRLLRSVVGPPRNMDWTLPWQEILHIWNERVRVFTWQAASKTWSENCLRHHWNVAQYFATFSQHCLGIIGSKNICLATSRA